MEWCWWLFRAVILQACSRRTLLRMHEAEEEQEEEEGGEKIRLERENVLFFSPSYLLPLKCLIVEHFHSILLSPMSAKHTPSTDLVFSLFADHLLCRFGFIFRHWIRSSCFGDTLRWCVVCAMFIALLLLIVHLHTTEGQPNCSFATNLYFSNAAVANQFRVINRTSLALTASYAHLPSFRSTFELGLIYRFSPNNSLVPFPIVFDCASQVVSCQLKIMTTTNNPSENAEPMRVRLTSLNYTNSLTTNAWSQMSLYLKQGRYQLNNCSLDDGRVLSDAQTIFHIDIQYEKALGK